VAATCFGDICPCIHDTWICGLAAEWNLRHPPYRCGERAILLWIPCRHGAPTRSPPPVHRSLAGYSVLMFDVAPDEAAPVISLYRTRSAAAASAHGVRLRRPALSEQKYNNREPHGLEDADRCVSHYYACLLNGRKA